MNIFKKSYWQERGVIPRWQYLLVYVLIVAAMIVGFAQVQSARDRTQQLAAQTNNSLCILRNDLQDRVNSSEKFLKNHPEGFAGISAATIRNSLDGQKRTIRALSKLDCQR